MLHNLKSQTFFRLSSSFRDRWRSAILGGFAAALAAITLCTAAGCNEARLQEEALRKYSYKGNMAILQDLLAQGVNVNARDEQGGTALMLAALAGNAEVVRLLLERGADANAQSDGGNTALIAAAGKGHVEILQILLDAGADPFIENKAGMTAAVNAAFSNQGECVIFLKKAEAAMEKESPEEKPD